MAMDFSEFRVGFNDVAPPKRHSPTPDHTEIYDHYTHTQQHREPPTAMIQNMSLKHQQLQQYQQYQQRTPSPPRAPVRGRSNSVSDFLPHVDDPPQMLPPSARIELDHIEITRGDVLASIDPEDQMDWAASALKYFYTHDTTTETQQTLESAIQIVENLAQKHSHPRAIYHTGKWFESGLFGRPKDRKEALRAYTRAAKRGFARAEWRLGEVYEREHDHAKTTACYHRGWSKGDAGCAFKLGLWTIKGEHGVGRSLAEGVELLEQAAVGADEDCPFGAWFLGLLYVGDLPGGPTPEEFPRDEAKAKSLIEQAAFLGYAPAQMRLGRAYEYGELSCDFDPAVSMHYYALASKGGFREADMALSKWFLAGAEGAMAPNEELAFKLAYRVAMEGNTMAEFAMGYFYEVGISVKPDPMEAEKWYAKSAAKGNVDAETRMNSIKRSGTLNRADHQTIMLTRVKSQHPTNRQRIASRERRETRQGAPLPPLPVGADQGALMPELPGHNSLDASSHSWSPPSGSARFMPAAIPEDGSGYAAPVMSLPNIPGQYPASPPMAGAQAPLFAPPSQPGKEEMMAPPVVPVAARGSGLGIGVEVRQQAPMFATPSAPSPPMFVTPSAPSPPRVSPPKDSRQARSGHGHHGQGHYGQHGYRQGSHSPHRHSPQGSPRLQPEPIPQQAFSPPHGLSPHDYTQLQVQGHPTQHLPTSPRPHDPQRQRRHMSEAPRPVSGNGHVQQKQRPHSALPMNAPVTAVGPPHPQQIAQQMSTRQLQNQHRMKGPKYQGQERARPVTQSLPAPVPAPTVRATQTATPQGMKKGPATFEEMGIPNVAKDKHDCVVM
ncbi:hypothetical protein SAICODRAFT_9010 [Saitoella complicata NRRL Y-17804]|uniref:uncharacterized protein n=1 Tax=Saitoella complicata (strain BCRC 22490 / CBS 7301 / JCM 7358 / NBRC 10748 / NRRL Y-17804) TaxID=698492 RepID=UPI000866C30D|nr:uncharacterized protein SAICODRAFT_9010 [Saitoella complicata NRRL Y-17804]ODQ51357.1 hypothetical protein SAICODRAFT_9010 [Saitoella complicata NRRL Y-17804]